MLTELFTQLPAASIANLTDIICAVQGYVSPTNLGLSTQMTLQQVITLSNASMILNYPGNPNGHVAGTAYQLLWDTTDDILYVCTTTGTISSAVWTPVIGQLTNGQIRIGSTGNVPVAATIIAGNNLLVTNGAGSITIGTATMGADTLFGNNTGGTAQPVPLNVTQVLTMLGVTAVGTAPIGQIPGTNTNDNAGTGDIGEFVSSVIASGSSISLSNNTPTNITSIVLTSGDWNVWGNVNMADSGGALNGAACWISKISATIPDLSLYNVIDVSVTNNLTMVGLNAPFVRISITTTTTVYLSCQVGIASGSATGCGGIFARRAR